MSRPLGTVSFVLAGMAVCLAAPHATHAQGAPYHWTISASDTDPFVNTTSIMNGEVRTFYLWLECCNLPDPLQDGMSAAQFDIVTSGSLLHLTTTAVNGFLNAGGTSNPLFAVGGCPCGPVVAAQLLVIDQGGGTMGLEASDPKGIKGVVDCSPNPQLWPMNWTGLGVGQPPPSKGDGCTPSLPGACCFPDGSCIQTSSSLECAALGGTYQGDGTDCSVGCPVTTGACCFEDGSCVDADTAADCAALGGVFQGAGTDCSGGCPSFAGACCFPDGSCVLADGPAACDALGGVFQGKGTDCSVGCPVLTGACCFEDGSCTITVAADCAALGGLFQGEGTDCSGGCPSLAGACCFPDGSCVLADGPSDCAALGGEFLGVGTDCSVGCPVLAGACCFEDGTCVITDSASECASLGGVFQGKGTDCSGGCPSFAGACCFGDGSCVIADGPSDCAAQGGNFLGVGTDCTQCPSVGGACCFSDGSCQQTDASTCAALGGQFHGVGSSCDFCNVQGSAAATWTISASAVDPFANVVSQPTFTVIERYLWLACCQFPFQPQGIAAAEFSIVSTGTIHLATTMQNGFLNAGGTADLLLAVAGCPCGPVVAATLLVLDQPGSLCFGSSPVGGVKAVVDCRAQPQAWAMHWTGFNNTGGQPCEKGFGCSLTSLEPMSWGRIKGMYR